MKSNEKLELDNIQYWVKCSIAEITHMSVAPTNTEMHQPMCGFEGSA